MKQRNTHPFSVSPHNAEKANGFAAQIPEALLLHSVPDLLQRGAGTDGYACWWALLRPAGSVQRGSSGAGGPGWRCRC